MAGSARFTMRSRSLSSFFDGRLSLGALLVMLGVSTQLGGCSRCSSGDGGSGGSGSGGAPSAAPSSAASAAGPWSSSPKVLGKRMPVGPRLVVQPGRGLSAIFFGATRQTIERHMQAPCDVATETRCGYVDAAVEFTLEGGVLSKVEVVARDRPVPGKPGAFYGTFRGILPPRVALGLHQHIVVEEYGKPDRQEDLELKAPTGPIARAYYDGLALEYERIENGNTVLAGMVITPSKTAKPVFVPMPQSGTQPATKQ